MPSKLNGMATYCFDLDMTLCFTEGTEYQSSKPMSERIRTVNELYDQGHKIIILTARGSMSGIDFYELTKGQLASWGIKYHSLQLGKPAADYYVDDKAVNSEDFEWTS